MPNTSTEFLAWTIPPFSQFDGNVGLYCDDARIIAEEGDGAIGGACRTIGPDAWARLTRSTRVGASHSVPEPNRRLMHHARRGAHEQLPIHAFDALRRVVGERLDLGGGPGTGRERGHG